MSFRLRADAEGWFSDIIGQFEFKFDAYYFCLMAGYVAVRRAPLTSADKPAFTDDFPGDWKLQQNMLLGGLIDCDLRDRGIAVTDKAAVQKVVSELLAASGTSSNLSAVGGGRMNEYASGGFDILFERMIDKPRKLETFLRAYAKLISELEAERAGSEARFEGVEP